MADRGVDQLNVIEVEVMQGLQRGRADAARHHVVEADFEVAAVVQAGKRIVDSQMFELLHGELAFGDVRQVAEDGFDAGIGVSFDVERYRQPKQFTALGEQPRFVFMALFAAAGKRMEGGAVMAAINGNQKVVKKTADAFVHYVMAEAFPRTDQKT